MIRETARCDSCDSCTSPGDKLVPGSRATAHPDGAAIVVLFLKPSFCDDVLRLE